MLGGELTFQTGAESPIAEGIPEQTRDRIIEAHLKFGTCEINGSDMFMDKATIGNNFSMRTAMDNKVKFDQLVEKISSGGEIFLKPQSMSQGGFEAMVTDQYGIEWGLVTPENN